MNLLNLKNRETNARLHAVLSKPWHLIYPELSVLLIWALMFWLKAIALIIRKIQSRLVVMSLLILRTRYHFNKNWMLSAKLNNLLDKNYQTVDTYNMAGRNFFVSVHYNN